MAKINKYWGLVAVGALTAAAAGAIAALVSRRSVCEEDFEDDFEDLDDFKDDEKKEEKEEKEVFQDWDKTASETVEVSKEAEDAEEAPTEAEEDWMTAVNSAPARIPSTGLENLVIRLMKVWESRSGIIAELIISIPINRIPKPAMILP